MQKMAINSFIEMQNIFCSLNTNFTKLLQNYKIHFMFINDFTATISNYHN